jgi:hypothetical protein
MKSTVLFFHRQQTTTEANMTHQEQHLIEIIKSKPNHQVFFGRNEGSVIVAITRKNGVSQQSVWLGRSSSVGRLQEIANSI